MKKSEETLIKNILGEDFFEVLAKSAIYKPRTASSASIEEIKIGLQIVPRTILTFLKAKLLPLQIGSIKTIEMDFGTASGSKIEIMKQGNDDYSGSIIGVHGEKHYSFEHRSIPGLGLVLLSTFELYDLENLEEAVKPVKQEEAPEHFNKINDLQQIINERLLLHELVDRVVSDKMRQRDAVQSMVSYRLNNMVFGKSASPTDTENKKQELADNPVDYKKDFVVEKFNKSEIKCNNCKQKIFKSGIYTGCQCTSNNKVYLSKSEGKVKVRFSKDWEIEDIKEFLNKLKNNKES